MHTIILIISKSVIKMEKITGWYKKKCMYQLKNITEKKIKIIYGN